LGNRPLAHFEALAGLTELRTLDITQAEVSDITIVANLPQLALFSAAHNHIRDVTPLAGLLNLSSVSLLDNAIDDVQPLADNPGLAADDLLLVQQNLLDCRTQNANLKALVARGVLVTSDCP